MGLLSSKQGLLIRRQIFDLSSGNLLLDDQVDFSGWNSHRVTIASDAVTGPDGITPADKLRETSETGIHRLLATSISGLTVTASYTTSIFAKAAERSRIRLNWWEGGTSWAVFNMATQAWEDAGNYVARGFVEYPNGWFRIWMAAVADNSAASVAFWLEDNSGSNSYTGVTDEGLYVTWAKVENGAGPPTRP